MTTLNPPTEYLDLFPDAPGGLVRLSIIRKIIFWVAIVWVPPIILSSTLVTDISFHVRGLLAIPILIASENYVQQRIGDVLSIIRDRRYLDEKDFKVLSRTMDRVRSLNQSKIVIGILYLICLIVISRQLYIQTPDWNMTGYAVWWNRWVSMSFYFFLLIKWFFRFILWSFFLLKFALLGPELPALHPDHLGGLSFILYRHIKFGLFVMGMSCVVSANISTAVMKSHLTIDSFVWPLVSYLLWIQLLLIAPLFSFTPLLVRAKREGLLSFGKLSGVYIHYFDKKWAGKNFSSEEMLGNGDFQSLSDVCGSYLHLANMKLFLMDTRCLLGFLFMTVTPLLPLILFKIPLKSLLTILTQHFL